MAKKRSKKFISPHKSFKRSYREDYVRELNVPKASEHIAKSFGMFFKNAKLFVPLLVVGIVIAFVTMGVPSIFNETVGVFGVVIFLVLWLTTIFLVRHIMAGHQIKLRDGLYNAMAPLVSAFVVFVVGVVQCLPLFLLTIAYSAALKTEFLATPFYALVFFVFAALMILASGYLLSGTLMAFVAVTAPGLYPMEALRTAAEMMMGRRVRFILRLLVLMILLAVVWAIVMAPLLLMGAPMEVLSVVIIILACFSCIYTAIYLYLYYRWMIKA